MSQNLLKTIHAARDAYRRNAWADATELFLRADAEAELEIDDLEALVWRRLCRLTIERCYRRSTGSTHITPKRGITISLRGPHSGAASGR
jgi:hypothetical protein